MLELKNIHKEYSSGDNAVRALKGINLEFRKNEFVSILGPSGCGKTTMLNIIGGLDHYSDGDLVINGKSTKDFSERDWDTYRNYSIGFVFQSYNLIPHQSVLQNVELSLALSGISKAERRRRSVEALEKVGLSNQLHKKPGEMSGGQMQRVAIARALVNNPDIILADEPTGALDSETSIQVMNILKEVASDRLVIMVTHNPDLAEKYSTRIVHMLDGMIYEDSNPLSDAERNAEREASASISSSVSSSTSSASEAPKSKGKKKPSMSIWTSFALSLKNLFTKKGRTILTAFAGSIGIIGIALIFAVSHGMTNYIDSVQEDTLSSYPLTIYAEHTDTSSMLRAFMEAAVSTSEHENDAVYEKNALYNLVKAINTRETKQNDLKTFRNFIENQLEQEDSELKRILAGRQYSYDYQLLVYTKNVDGKIIQSDTQALAMQMMSRWLGSATIADAFSSMQSSFGGSMPMSQFIMGSGLWQELLPGDNGSIINDYILNQYELVYGDYPNDANEIVIVVDENNEIDDMTMYALGLKSEEEIYKIVDAATGKTELPPKSEPTKISYEDICSRDYRVILNGSCYMKGSDGNLTDMRTFDQGLNYLYGNAIKLKVTGIIRPKKDILAPMLTGTICYTYKLTEKIIQENQDNEAIKAQQNSPNIDVFTGLPFEEGGTNMTAEEKAEDFRKYIDTLGESGKADAYVKVKAIMPSDALDKAVNDTIGKMTLDEMIDTMAKTMSAQMGMNEALIKMYLKRMSEEEIRQLFTQAAVEQIKAEYTAQIEAQLSGMTTEQKAEAFDAEYKNYTVEECAQYYDEVLTFSDSTYDSNMQKLGFVDVNSPSAISLYSSSFESKDALEQLIVDYNNAHDEEYAITYTDYVGLIMSSITTIINAITYVLIAFVAVSLVVSSIMIGVITLISVQERTKEIGILRAIGASKRNVSSLFNAETIIIGFASGLLGVLLTYILCLPINAILRALTGIANLRALLPPSVALILIAISVILTLIAGIIPSRSAAKKDPVVALRSE